jgi:hypothetical protein
MMTRRTARLVVTSLCAAGVVLGGTALAGTPLPDPPFSGGGFVPPTKLALTQELNAAKLIAKYAGKRAKCDHAALIALQLAYEPVGTPKVPEVQQKWTQCVQKVDLFYTVQRDKLLLKGSPSCLGQTGIDVLRALVDAQFSLLASIVYCDGDAAAPDPVTGLDIPDFKQEAEGEMDAGKGILKARLYAGKCYMKAVNVAFKFIPSFGMLPPEQLATIEACLQKASDVVNASLLKLDQTQKLPACFPLATAQSAADNAVAATGLITAINYCASPSGAFVDG